MSDSFNCYFVIYIFSGELFSFTDFQQIHFLNNPNEIQRIQALPFEVWAVRPTNSYGGASPLDIDQIMDFANSVFTGA